MCAGKLLEKLVEISNEEGAHRSSVQLPDTSQTGSYDCFRNEVQEDHILCPANATLADLHSSYL
eukprot:COSAG05_NODE_3912_length_1776_cov_155.137150_3_plen_64_part_00